MKGEIDPSLLMSIAQQHVLNPERNQTRLFDQERHALEVRAQQAEDDVKRLQERTRTLERALEEVKKEYSLLRAQLEYSAVTKGEASTVLGECYSAEAVKEIDISYFVPPCSLTFS